MGEAIASDSAALARDNQSGGLESPGRALLTNLHFDNDIPVKQLSLWLNIV